MCVTFGSSEMTNTKIFVWQVPNGDHCVIYRNNVASFSGPNAMLLAVPTSSEITRQHMLEPTWCKNVLDDLDKAYPGLPVAAYTFGKGAQVFESGAYHVVSADSVQEIKGALHQVPTEKRPALNEKLLGWYQEKMLGYRFLLACFNQTRKTEAEPFGYRYTPRDDLRDVLVAPMWDAHDGSPPVDGQVKRDHVVYFGLKPDTKPQRWVESKSVSWSEGLDGAAGINLPQRVAKAFFPEPYPNGDAVLRPELIYCSEDGQGADFMPRTLFALA